MTKMCGAKDGSSDKDEEVTANLQIEEVRILHTLLVEVYVS